MDLREEHKISLDDEVAFWWIKTRFLYIQHALDLIKKSNLSVKEYGFGTGPNIYFLDQSDKVQDIYGYDPNFKQGQYSFSSKVALSANDSQKKYDLVLLMDVLEHVDDHHLLLQNAYNSIESGGLILITVPAFNFLWSRHDEFLGHHRRYTLKEILGIIRQYDVEVLKAHYIFSLLVFPMLLLRKILRLNQEDNDYSKTKKSMVNKMLFQIFKLEYFWGGNKYLGTSIVVLLKKN